MEGLSTIEILKKINEEDKKIAYKVEEELENIKKAVDLIVEVFNRGGRLFYLGSGTSGKLGVIDASECPPTFGVEDGLFIGILSGGKEAFSGWLEVTEDDEELSIEDLKKRNLSGNDVIVGITASGNTPYVLSGIKYGKSIGCKTIGLQCNKAGKLKDICDVAISIEVGEEVLLGSTRMKAGTAQKMVLNMLSTTAMIKTGKTYSNLMVNVKPINKKLQKRVVEIVMLACDVDEEKAKEVLKLCDFDAKLAILIIKSGISVENGRMALKISGDSLYKAFLYLENNKTFV